MELTENTLSVLKNFSGINQNILMKQGNVIKTISEARNTMPEVQELFQQPY